MPEAIATTKRKFYKALETLSNPSPSTTHSTHKTTSFSSLRPSSEPLIKRVRRETSNGSTIGQPLKVEFLSRGQIAQAQHDAIVNGNKSSVAPNFAPWSHEAFLTRLKTFSSVSTWHPKPDLIGEVEWAKRGWICSGVNTVVCRGGCERQLVVDLQQPQMRRKAGQGEAAVGENGHADEGGLDEEAEEEAETEDAGDEESFERLLVQRYEGMIVSGHAQGCLWRQTGCKDDIYHLQVVRPAVWQPALAQRYTSLLEISPAIESVKIRGLPPDRDAAPGSMVPIASPAQLLTDLSESVLSGSKHNVSDQAREKALTIALHGWSGSTEAGNNLLSCHACFQRIGLWMYQPDYTSAFSTSSPHSPSRNRTHNPLDMNNDVDRDHERNKAGDDFGNQDDETSHLLDLTEMHREHCPWSNGRSQHASGGFAGLNAIQILFRVTSTFAREQRRKHESRPTTFLMNEENENDHGVNGHVVNGSVDMADEQDETDSIKVQSREEIVRQDRERESRLKRLKNLFTIKRHNRVKATGAIR